MGTRIPCLWLFTEEWLAWLADASKSAAAAGPERAPEAFKVLQNVGEAAVRDCPAPSVWQAYIEGVDAVLDEQDGVEEVDMKALYERALRGPVGREPLAFPLWKSFVEWLSGEAADALDCMRQVEAKAGPDAGAALAQVARELPLATNALYTALATWLSIPSPRLTEALSVLSSTLAMDFVTSVPPPAEWKEQVEAAATAAAVSWAEQADEWRRIVDAGTALAEDAGSAEAQGVLVAAWEARVDRLSKGGKGGGLHALAAASAAVRQCYWHVPLWHRLVQGSRKAAVAGDSAAVEGLVHALQRAVRNLPWHGPMWRQAMTAVEWAAAKGVQPWVHPFRPLPGVPQGDTAAPAALVAAEVAWGMCREAAPLPLQPHGAAASLHATSGAVWARLAVSCQDQGVVARAKQAATKAYRQAVHLARRGASGGGDVAALQQEWATVLCRALGDWDTGCQVWQELLQGSPKDAALALAAASCAVACGHPDTARGWLKSALHFLTGDPSATLWLAQQWQTLEACAGDACAAWETQGILETRREAASAKVAAAAAAAAAAGGGRRHKAAARGSKRPRAKAEASSKASRADSAPTDPSAAGGTPSAAAAPPAPSAVEGGASEPAAKRARPQDKPDEEKKAAVVEAPPPEALAKSGGVDSRELVLVFVNNLPYSASDSDVRAVFESVGPVHQVRLQKGDDGKLKGFGTVSFKPGQGQAAAELEQAALAKDGTRVLGRPMAVTRFERMSKRWADTKAKAAQAKATEKAAQRASERAPGVSRKKVLGGMFVPAALRRKAVGKKSQTKAAGASAKSAGASATSGTST